MSDFQAVESFRGNRVLVVEDDLDSMTIISVVLELAAAEVIQAGNGREGMQLALERIPDFIITDLMMPEMDGWQMARALKREATTKDIPVIALTADTLPDARERAVTTGFHYFISKPIRPETFIQELVHALNTTY